jgi:alpha-tubulin suppressor-like RCC1 family protein
MPSPAVDIGGPVAQLAVARASTCALLETGKVRCWGSGGYGQLGYGNTNTLGDGPGEMPPADVDLGVGVITQLAAGAEHYCALFQGGSVRCWGRSIYGELGQGNTNSIGDGPGEMPPPVVNVGGNVVRLELAAYMSCAVLDTGMVRCWGFNSYEQLGVGGSHLGDNPGEMPPDDINLGGSIAWLLPGSERTTNCVVFDDSSVRCWGYGAYGALGLGNTFNLGGDPNDMPPPVVQLW